MRVCIVIGYICYVFYICFIIFLVCCFTVVTLHVNNVVTSNLFLYFGFTYFEMYLYSLFI